MTSHDPDSRLRTWAEDHAVDGPDLATSQSVAEGLVARAGARRVARRRAGLAGATAALALVGALVLWPSPEPTAPPPSPVAGAAPTLPAPTPWQAEVLYQEGSVSTALAQTITVPVGDRLVLALGPDRLGLASDTALVVEQAREALTRLRLDHGTLAAEVGHRETSGRFVVMAGEVEIAVTGTRLAVTHTADAVEVRVAEGQVEVRAPGAAWTLSAGRRLRLDETGEHLEELAPDDTRIAALLASAPVPDKPPPGPSTPPPLNRAPETAPASALAEARGLLLSGQTDQAIATLTALLDRDPADSEGWTLLATAHRRAGHPREALVAWRQVVLHTTGALQAQARYQVASLLQDGGDAAGALPELEALVGDPTLNRSLAPDAQLRLGRAQLSLGRTDTARETLTRVVRDHPGTQPAVTAAGLLGGL